MAVNLREVVAISGRSGLFRVVSPARQGLVVESLDGKKTRTVIAAQQPVSALSDISIYTTTEDGTVPLVDVLQQVRQQFGPQIELTAKSAPQELVEFMGKAVPDYDRDRVYLSDIKKLVTWYNVLGPHLDEAADASLSTGGEVPAQDADAADDKPVA